MSDRRVLGFAWLVATVCLWYVLADISGWAFRNLGIADPALAGSFQLSSLTAMVISGVASAICWRTPKVFDFCIETIIETRKVVWPTKKETRDHTVVVIVTSICIALMLWGFDLVFKRLFGVILNLGGA
jgi:preprotein translocase subunit SecE